jgi:hypothetical protein
LPKLIPLERASRYRRRHVVPSNASGKRVYDEITALDGREQEWWAKIPAHVLRLAGTIAFMEWALHDPDEETDWVEPSKILRQHVNAAARLVFDYFWPHARACLRQIGLTQRHADARRVLRGVKAQDLQQIGREEIRRNALSQRLDADDTEAVLAELCHAGWLRQLPVAKGRGRPAKRWEVNPQL